MTKVDHKRIRPFDTDDADAFRRLNIEWITKYFAVEDTDLEQLHNPQKIIDDGGAILIAEIDGEIVGCCALLKESGASFELVKMAVTESARGLGIGWELGKAALDTAKSNGAKSVHLESSTVLTPAITLYKKLGFAEDSTHTSPYARCNIQMVCSLNGF